MQIIAEIGSNWLGNGAIALEHIKQAAQSGATGVKFQLFRANELYEEPPPSLDRYELSLEQLDTFREAAHAHDLTFSCTPFSPELAEACKGKLDAVKISAYDLTYDDLLEACAGLDIPIVLSTAMATIPEIAHALDVLNKPKEQITILHGTAAYPAEPKDCHLKALISLKGHYHGHPIGLSNHSTSTTVLAVAFTLGIDHLEQHFCIDNPKLRKQSPDGPHSLAPVEFTLVTRKLAPLVVSILGSPDKTGPLPVELPLFTTCRRTNAQPKRRTV